MCAAKLEEKIPTVEDKDKQEMFKGQLVRGRFGSAPHNYCCNTLSAPAMAEKERFAVPLPSLMQPLSRRIGQDQVGPS